MALGEVAARGHSGARQLLRSLWIRSPLRSCEASATPLMEASNASSRQAIRTYQPKSYTGPLSWTVRGSRPYGLTTATSRVSRAKMDPCRIIRSLRRASWHWRKLHSGEMRTMWRSQGDSHNLLCCPCQRANPGSLWSSCTEYRCLAAHRANVAQIPFARLAPFMGRGQLPKLENTTKESN